MFASIEGGTDVVLIVELMQSFVFLLAFMCLFCFFIHLFKVWLLYFHLQPVSVMSPVKPVGGNAGKVSLHESDQRKLNLTVRCSLREVEDCAKLLESRHVARVHSSGFGSIFKWRVKSAL